MRVPWALRPLPRRPQSPISTVCLFRASYGGNPAVCSLESLTRWRACRFLGVFPLLSVVLFVNALSCPCFQMLRATSLCSSGSHSPHLCRADRDRVPQPPLQGSPSPHPGDSMLSLLKPWVQSLVGELKSHKPRGTDQKIKKLMSMTY